MADSALDRRHAARRVVASLGAAVAAAFVGVACGGGGSDAASTPATIRQASAAQLTAARLDRLPLAPPDQRVDVAMPEFSNPTRVTNPLFPIANLRSAVLAGKVDGKDFKTETTLLPETRLIEWPDGRPVETLVSQYVAYLDGRIEEVALDLYAQADDGSVWYFGEDVFNYGHGAIADTEGTWFAGKEGPAAMIMPADPKVGDVYRPENVPGLVFEEVRVKTVGKTVKGPRGLVARAMIADELHQDGSREDKTFAPGYGEFFTGGGGDVEAMALAVPTDRLSAAPPAELEAISTGADEIFKQARAKDWKAVSAAVARATRDWRAFREGNVPPRLAARMSRALETLTGAVDARRPANAARAAIDVAQATLDLRLRHRPPTEIDCGRFDLWAGRLIVDAGADDATGVRGELATLEWIRDRFAETLDDVDRTRIDTHLVELRADLNDDDLRGAADEARRLRQTIAASHCESIP